MSLYEAKTVGDYAWPQVGTATYVELASWLTRLTTLPMSEAFNIRRDRGRPAHKAMGEGEWVGTRLNDALPAWRDDGLWTRSNGDLFSLTYCLAQGDARRVYGFIAEGTLYPVLWDPRHELLGNAEPQRNQVPPQACRACLHPPRQ